MFITDEYLEGKRAYREGYGLDECPYPYGSNEYEDWQNGYSDAEGENYV